MQNTPEMVEQVMQTPFSEAMQSIWVISAVLLAVAYGIGVYQCRRIAKPMMRANRNSYSTRGQEILTSTDKWFLCIYFLFSPAWAPIALFAEWIGRCSHAAVVAFADNVLSSQR